MVEVKNKVWVAYQLKGCGKWNIVSTLTDEAPGQFRLSACCHYGKRCNCNKTFNFLWHHLLNPKV